MLQTIVHGETHNPGMRNSSSAVCIFVAYKLSSVKFLNTSFEKISWNEELIENESSGDEEDEDKIEVLHQIGAGNLKSQITVISDENKRMSESIKKMEYNNRLLEERISYLELLVEKENL